MEVSGLISGTFALDMAAVAWMTLLCKLWYPSESSDTVSVEGFAVGVVFSPSCSRNVPPTVVPT